VAIGNQPARRSEYGNPNGRQVGAVLDLTFQEADLSVVPVGELMVIRAQDGETGMAVNIPVTSRTLADMLDDIDELAANAA
jgi:hypothetical protein